MRCIVAIALAFVTDAVLAAPPGRWKFQEDDRPVKAVVIGGSVSAWQTGSFAQWMGAACQRLEVVNRGQARLGAKALRERFESEVVKNRLLGLKDRVEAEEEIWLIFMAGLNSIGNPEATNIEVTRTFERAHDVGLKVMGLTPNPWGADSDRRWRGLDGLVYLEHSLKVVDHFLGRLGVEEALGRFAEGREDLGPHQRADVAVDLWDSTLRDREAPLRDLAPLEREARRSALVRARTRGLDEAAAEQVRAELIGQAAALPRQFMQKRFHGFDAIHPNADGHREIALAMCAAAPPSWGCDCALIARSQWDRKARAPAPLMGDAP